MNKEQGKLNRRKFLKTTTRIITSVALTAGGLNLLHQPAAQASQISDDLDNYDFIIPRVKFLVKERVISPWNTTPGAEKNLLTEFSKVVRCKVKLCQNCNNYKPGYGQDYHFNSVVDLTDFKELKKCPMLFMTSEGHYVLTDEKKRNLKQFINEGGFLLMDDCVFDMVGDFFYQDSYKLLEELFGPGSIRKIGRDHEIFHNIYDLGDIGLPHLWGQNHGARGVFIGDRLAVFLSSTDIHCAWTDKQGLYQNKARTRNLGKHGYKEAIQMGINIIMYVISH